MKYAVLLLASTCFLAAQPTLCNTASNAPLLRHEGLTERIGDIVFNCTGAAGSKIVFNISVQLNANITNRITTGNVALGTVVTTDNGTGPLVNPQMPVLLTPSLLLWQSIGGTFSSQGFLTIRVANVLVNASGIPLGQQVAALLGGTLSISPSQVIVGISENSLYVGYSGKIICAQNGSPLPSTPGFAAMLYAGTQFTSTRLTEAYLGAFSPKFAPANLNADHGTRFLIQYSGFPQGSRLFVPNLIAGSDASIPTAGGDLGTPASAGQYTPTANGSLLLALVSGADSTGTGGLPSYTPGLPGSGTLTLDSVTELTLTAGAAYAVYEVVDYNPTVMEVAQFPTFLGLAPNVVQNNVQTSEGVTYAAVSTVTTATASDPIPRFLALTPLSDCNIIGDCGASYFPQLQVQTSTLQFPFPGGTLDQVQYVPVLNVGAGVMYWTASITYLTGGGWLSINPTSGANNGTIRVGVNTTNLPVGTYQANLVVDAGTAGRRLIAVTLTIAAVQLPGPQVTSVVNAATFLVSPVVPGSLSTIFGSGFAGKSVTVSFNGLFATILFSNATQINMLVPAGLGPPNPAQMVVTVDGQSATQNVPVAPFSPGIFTGAVLNQDYSVNSQSNPAAAGSVVFFWGTGLSGAGTITVRIGTTEISDLYYAGPAPGYPGVQQVNVGIPYGVSGVTTQIYACGTSGGNEVCSPGVPLVVK
ncbi:MAG TPA: IPT/TIG domain-containing protein [Bryobacteraceae bacterium]|nr:IPT/TIG domain-containing protein [Bryobacteraceae bacterium]